MFQDIRKFFSPGGGGKKKPDGGATSQSKPAPSEGAGKTKQPLKEQKPKTPQKDKGKTDPRKL